MPGCVLFACDISLSQYAVVGMDIHMHIAQIIISIGFAVHLMSVADQRTMAGLNGSLDLSSLCEDRHHGPDASRVKPKHLNYACGVDHGISGRPRRQANRRTTKTS